MGRTSGFIRLQPREASAAETLWPGASCPRARFGVCSKGNPPATHSGDPIMGFQCPTATCCLELFLINFIFEFVFLSDISWVSGVCIRETEPGFIQLPTPLLRCRDHTCLHSGRGPGHRHPGGSHTPCVPSHQARPLATLGYCIRPTNNPMTQRKSEICSVVSSSLQPQGLYCPWNSPGQNTGVGSLSLLQGDLPNAGNKPRSLSLQADSLLSE